MKNLLIIVGIIVVAFFCVKKCSTGGSNDGTPIDGYSGTVSNVEGTTLVLSSGLRVRLLGVENGNNEVEAFLKTNYLGRGVTLYADSQSQKKTITSADDVVDAYAVETGTRGYCINRIAVLEYPEAYRESETHDSVGWIIGDTILQPKKNLSLYMKQRTFLIITNSGVGTGFFINEDGLAVTNWHVLSPGEERSAIAVLFEDDANNSNVEMDKKRNFKNIKFSEDIRGLDLTVVTVELENGEKVPYFNIAKREPNQGDIVATYGNPGDGNGDIHTATYAPGVIRRLYTDERGTDMIEYTIPTNGGNSGGPVCDKYGQIVAIHEIGDKSMQNANAGINAQQLRKILDKKHMKYGGR